MEQREEIAAKTIDREGRQVVLPVRIWTKKILFIHPELGAFLTDVLRTVEAPTALNQIRVWVVFAALLGEWGRQCGCLWS